MPKGHLVCDEAGSRSESDADATLDEDPLTRIETFVRLSLDAFGGGSKDASVKGPPTVQMT